MKSLIIIDGNNLLNKSSVKNCGGDQRINLYEIVKSRLPKSQNVIFFFDGFGDVKRSDIKYSNDKIADELMRTFIEKNYDKRNLTVVSSDRGITELARVCGCKVKTSEDYWKEIDHTTKGKNINQLYISPEESEKPERLSKKELDEFRKYFT